MMQADSSLARLRPASRGPGRVTDVARASGVLHDRQRRQAHQSWLQHRGTAAAQAAKFGRRRQLIWGAGSIVSLAALLRATFTACS